jgi:hypothetical protein
MQVAVKVRRIIVPAGITVHEGAFGEHGCGMRIEVLDLANGEVWCLPCSPRFALEHARRLQNVANGIINQATGTGDDAA